MFACVLEVVVGPALNVLYKLGVSDKLKPLVLRLACALWQQQDRAFPHLLHMIADYESSSAQGGWMDMMLARAACVRDICRLRCVYSLSHTYATPFIPQASI